MAAVGLVQTESGLRRVHFAALSGRLAHMMLSSCLHTLLFQPKKLRLNNCKDFKKKTAGFVCGIAAPQQWLPRRAGPDSLNVSPFFLARWWRSQVVQVGGEGATVSD
jgi:hypothetical protein